MSTVACEIVGTGDGRLKSPAKSDGTASKTIAKDLVLEIIDNALDIVDDPSDVPVEKNMDKMPVEEYKEKHAKEKCATPLIGTGDQKSNEGLETQESVPYHPPVEKKNRLTDLVKNSKQILARIMMSDSKMELHEEKKEEEQVVEVIELDCVQISDIPFKSRSKIMPEEVPLPKNDSEEILTPQSSEGTLDEVGLSPTKEGNREIAEPERMTFPRTSGARAKAAFAAKCRTLKREANNLKKKKWNFRGKLAGIFRKRRDGNDDGGEEKSKETGEQRVKK